MLFWLLSLSETFHLSDLQEPKFGLISYNMVDLKSAANSVSSDIKQSKMFIIKQDKSIFFSFTNLIM